MCMGDTFPASWTKHEHQMISSRIGARHQALWRRPLHDCPHRVRTRSEYCCFVFHPTVQKLRSSNISSTNVSVVAFVLMSTSSDL